MALHLVAHRPQPTRWTPRALHQSWVWDKKMELGELAYGKLIRVRGLDWLIAPRLYVRTLVGKFAVFYAADPSDARRVRTTRARSSRRLNPRVRRGVTDEKPAHCAGFIGAMDAGQAAMPLELLRLHEAVEGGLR